jgi:hypothetical protein
MARGRVAVVVLVATLLTGLVTLGTWLSWPSGTARQSGGGMMASGWGTAAGPGMMRSPMMGGPGMMGGLAGDGNRVTSLVTARIRAAVLADRLGLRVGEVMWFDNGFYAELLTAGGQGATEVLIDPTGGAVRPEFGPAMMWNTGYGMHAGLAAGPERVSAGEAPQIAQRWLD